MQSFIETQKKNTLHKQQCAKKSFVWRIVKGDGVNSILSNLPGFSILNLQGDEILWIRHFQHNKQHSYAMTNNGHCQVLLTKAVVTHVVWDIKEKQRPHVGSQNRTVYGTGCGRHVKWYMYVYDENLNLEA